MRKYISFAKKQLIMLLIFTLVSATFAPALMAHYEDSAIVEDSMVLDTDNSDYIYSEDTYYDYDVESVEEDQYEDRDEEDQSNDHEQETDSDEADEYPYDNYYDYDYYYDYYYDSYYYDYYDEDDVLLYEEKKDKPVLEIIPITINGRIQIDSGEALVSAISNPLTRGFGPLQLELVQGSHIHLDSDLVITSDVAIYGNNTAITGNNSNIFIAPHGGTLTLHDTFIRDSVVYVSGSFTMESGAIFTGVIVDNDGHFVMNGGLMEIPYALENAPQGRQVMTGGYRGSGVYLASGSFTMNGGTLRRDFDAPQPPPTDGFNPNAMNQPAVFLAGIGVEFIMNGGTITGWRMGVGGYTGSVYSRTHGSVTINDGVIEDVVYGISLTRGHIVINGGRIQTRLVPGVDAIWMGNSSSSHGYVDIYGGYLIGGSQLNSVLNANRRTTVTRHAGTIRRPTGEASEFGDRRIFISPDIAVVRNVLRVQSPANAVTTVAGGISGTVTVGRGQTQNVLVRHENEVTITVQPDSGWMISPSWNNGNNIQQFRVLDPATVAPVVVTTSRTITINAPANGPVHFEAPGIDQVVAAGTQGQFTVSDGAQATITVQPANGWIVDPSWNGGNDTLTWTVNTDRTENPQVIQLQWNITVEAPQNSTVTVRQQGQSEVVLQGGQTQTFQMLDQQDIEIITEPDLGYVIAPDWNGGNSTLTHRAIGHYTISPVVIREHAITIRGPQHGIAEVRINGDLFDTVAENEILEFSIIYGQAISILVIPNANHVIYPGWNSGYALYEFIASEARHVEPITIRQHSITVTNPDNGGNITIIIPGNPPVAIGPGESVTLPALEGDEVTVIVTPDDGWVISPGWNDGDNEYTFIVDGTKTVEPEFVAERNLTFYAPDNARILVVVEGSTQQLEFYVESGDLKDLIVLDGDVIRVYVFPYAGYEISSEWNNGNAEYIFIVNEDRVIEPVMVRIIIDDPCDDCDCDNDYGNGDSGGSDNNDDGYNGNGNGNNGGIDDGDQDGTPDDGYNNGNTNGGTDADTGTDDDSTDNNDNDNSNDVGQGDQPGGGSGNDSPGGGTGGSGSNSGGTGGGSNNTGSNNNTVDRGQGQPAQPDNDIEYADIGEDSSDMDDITDYGNNDIINDVTNNGDNEITSTAYNIVTGITDTTRQRGPSISASNNNANPANNITLPVSDYIDIEYEQEVFYYAENAQDITLLDEYDYGVEDDFTGDFEHDAQHENEENGSRSLRDMLLSNYFLIALSILLLLFFFLIWKRKKKKEEEERQKHNKLKA